MNNSTATSTMTFERKQGEGILVDDADVDSDDQNDDDDDDDKGSSSHDDDDEMIS